MNHFAARVLLLALGLATFLVRSPSTPAAAGYTFHRVTVWSEPGHAPPRFYQDPEIRRFVLDFPDSLPTSKRSSVTAERFVLRGRAFLPAEPARITRGSPQDPGWVKRRSETSLDLNRDGRTERIRGWSVEVPDPEDPGRAHHRVLIEIWEGERILFGDLLAGPDGAPVTLHSVSAFDFTGEGYADLVIRMETEESAGIAFYSQSSLHLPGSPKEIIHGFSETAFRTDRYGVFDLKRSPEEFLERLPDSARPGKPICSHTRGLVDPHARSVCNFYFDPPYLGWVDSFTIDYEQSKRILAFELWFPAGEKALTPRQALDRLRPVLGGSCVLRKEGSGQESRSIWLWRGNGATARLVAQADQEGERAVSLRLERN